MLSEIYRRRLLSCLGGFAFRLEAMSGVLWTPKVGVDFELAILVGLLGSRVVEFLACWEGGCCA